MLSLGHHAPPPPKTAHAASATSGSKRSSAESDSDSGDENGRENDASSSESDDADGEASSSSSKDRTKQQRRKEKKEARRQRKEAKRLEKAEQKRRKKDVQSADSAAAASDSASRVLLDALGDVATLLDESNARRFVDTAVREGTWLSFGGIFSDGSTTLRSVTSKQKRRFNKLSAGADVPMPPVPIACVFLLELRGQSAPPTCFFLPLPCHSSALALAIRTVLCAERLPKVCFNIKTTLVALLRFVGPVVDGSIAALPCASDPRIMAWLLDSDGSLFGEEFAFADICAKASVPVHGHVDDSELSASEIRCLLSDLGDAFALDSALRAKLEEVNLQDSYAQQEMAVAVMLAQMEYTGMTFRRDVLERHVGAMQTRLQQISDEAHRVVGADVLISSPEQVSNVLFGCERE